jgi:alpha-amylase/alpha-mannosidase (GH57 family)
MERFVCVHGHFYQPPRENPWLERVELQDSAEPYHDWNERVTAECYAPNSVSRIVDPDGRILQIIDNYSHMSFDFGPTLLSWMETESPEAYGRILEADAESCQRFGGHGSGMALVYNHVILPLCNSRDKRTEIRWGLRDFAQRFHRAPEGLWLPETAVDLESLDLAAEAGVRFVVLAPHQGLRVRPLNGNAPWTDVSGGRIDTGAAYLVRLRSGRSLAVFFYNGSLSHDVAFSHLLDNGEELARRLSGHPPDRPDPAPGATLANIATDGETYGHHHRHGDMALSYAFHLIETRHWATLTNYAQWLSLHPPDSEVEIAENTSWSCPHGVERWRSDCGCRIGSPPSWQQAWRTPLRQSLDWLRDQLIAPFEKLGGELFHDPWAARDDYIEVLLERSPAAREAFLTRHARVPLSPEQRTQALRLLELQRHALLMYTSCGWFFDDISRMESVQILRYAARAIQLAEGLFGLSLEEGFLERLRLARSNLPEQGTGADVYRTHVQPARVDLNKVAAHFAISSLFSTYGASNRIYCYQVEKQDYRLLEQGRTRLAVGRVRITSELTEESGEFSFGVIHFGDHNLSAGVRPYRGPEEYRAFVEEVGEAFSRADLPQVIHQVDEHFGGVTYSFRSLFRTEQRAILGRLIEEAMGDTEESFRGVYRKYTPFMRYLQDLNMPLPRAFLSAAEYTLNSDLRRCFGGERPDLEEVERLLSDLQRWQLKVESGGLGLIPQLFLERGLENISRNPMNLENLQYLRRGMGLLHRLPVSLNLWRAQNLYFKLLQEVYPQVQERAGRGEQVARSWVEAFLAIGRELSIRVD